MAGMGKTGFIKVIKEHCEKNNLNVVIASLRGTVARLCGGATIASALDLAAFEGSDFDSLGDGSARKDTRRNAINLIRSLDIGVLEEWAELSDTRLDVRI